MRVDIWNKPQVHVPSGPANASSPERGRFFSEYVRLRPGDYSVRIQIMFSPSAAGEAIELRAVDTHRGVTLASEAVTADPANPERADHIYLDFSVSSESEVRLLGLAERHAETTLLRYISVISKVAGASRDAFHFADVGPGALSGVKQFNFGTTGVCTASCIHCPTNKRDRRMPVGRMGMDLFEKIVLELRDGDYRGELFFGLFAEPLDDFLLQQRVEMLKRYLPGRLISIATNCSHFDRKKHEAIVAMVDNIGVHVESTTAEIYDKIMDPLKAARVFPRVESLIQTARELGRNNVTLTTPVHRGNVASFDRISEYFGLDQTDFTSLSNRAWNAGPFQELAFAPVGVCCKPDVLRDTIFVDWDGTMLPCCFDFSKSMPLGNLNNQTFTEIFASDSWNALSETFRRGEWSKQKACASCRVDQRETVNALATKISRTNGETANEYEPWRFTYSPIISGNPPRLGEAIHYETLIPDGIVVWGPYVSLPKGRYRLVQRLTPTAEGSTGEIELDVTCKGEAFAHTRKIAVAELSEAGIALDYAHEGEGLLEFRVLKFGDVAFHHAGATVIPLDNLSGASVPEPRIDSAPTLPEDPIARRFAARDFKVAAKEGADSRKSDATFHEIEAAHPDGIVIFGPFATLPKGRYRVLHHLQLTSPSLPDDGLTLDAACDGQPLLVRGFNAHTATAEGFQIVFEHDGLGEIEFRVHKSGPVGFRHFGVTLALEGPVAERQVPDPAPAERSRRKFWPLPLIKLGETRAPTPLRTDATRSDALDG